MHVLIRACISDSHDFDAAVSYYSTCIDLLIRGFMPFKIDCSKLDTSLFIQ